MCPREPSKDLIEAVWRKNYDVAEVQKLLDSTPEAIDDTDYYGASFLAIAATRGQTSAVAILQAHNADVEATDDHGRTAPHSVKHDAGKPAASSRHSRRRRDTESRSDQRATACRGDSLCPLNAKQLRKSRRTTFSHARSSRQGYLPIRRQPCLLHGRYQSLPIRTQPPDSLPTAKSPSSPFHASTSAKTDLRNSAITCDSLKRRWRSIEPNRESEEFAAKYTGEAFPDCHVCSLALFQIRLRCCALNP